MAMAFRILIHLPLTLALLPLPAQVVWKQTADGLTVELPAQRPCDFAFALEISPRRN